MVRFSLEVGFSTDVGRQRQRNEDSYAVFVPYPGEGNPSQLAGLILVADGMGGERAGDRASELTSERLRHWFSTGAYRSWPQYAGEQALESALVHAIRKVSKEIYQLGEEDPSIRGLGSTVVVGAMTSRRMVLAHVGDSRAYRIRGGEIELLTSDHSWVQRQVDAGVITAEAARSHPQRNILTRSLGDALPPEVDLISEELRDGDLFVLCSDGLTGGLTDADVLDLGEQVPEPQALAEALVRMANDRDGSDNITAVVGLCREADEERLRDFEEQTTKRILLHDDEADDHGGDEEDTRVIVGRSSSAQTGREDSPGPATWKTWLLACLVALALGLLAGYLVQTSRRAPERPRGETVEGLVPQGASVVRPRSGDGSAEAITHRGALRRDAVGTAPSAARGLWRPAPGSPLRAG